jgi:hypothetical protein
MKPPSNLKLIEEHDMPCARRSKKAYDQWLENILKIPKGKAWIMSEDEAGSYAAVRMMVKSLKQKGRLPLNIIVRLRTIEGKKLIYIVNSAKEC